MDRVTCASSKDKHQRCGSKGCSSPQEYLGHLEVPPLQPESLPCHPRQTKGKGRDTSQAPQILLPSSLSEKQKGLATSESLTQPLLQAESVLGEDSFI